MNCQHPFAEPPLKNVSNKLPEASGKSTDTEKGFVPSTSELNLMVHKTLQTEDPLAPGQILKLLDQTAIPWLQCGLGTFKL